MSAPSILIKPQKKTGCPECKKIKTSQTHKGKILSNKTRALIGEKASQRTGSLKNKFGENHPCFKGGYGRDKKTRSTQYSRLLLDKRH